MVPSFGGRMVILHESVSMMSMAHELVVPRRLIFVAFSDVQVRSTVVLFGTLPAEGTSDQVGLWRIFVGVKSEFGSLQSMIFEE